MRSRALRRMAIIAAVLVVVALLFLVSSHWLLFIIFAIPAVVAVWMFVQARSVR